MSLNSTPRANRLHIGFFGRRNSGKSSLVNALTGQEVAIVSPVLGTTTDPVYKAMEIHGLGPCVLIDTAGFDDEGELGEIRIGKTEQALEKTDVAVLLFHSADIELELQWYERLRERKTPVICVISQADLLTEPDDLSRRIETATGEPPLLVSVRNSQSVLRLREALLRVLPEDYDRRSIVAHLVNPEDTVLLVMPQDIQAPAGRLILPQVQTIRELLDHHCVVVSVTTDQLPAALAALTAPPALIITDSQVFRTVYEQKPAESRLTSFSVLFAAYKGDLPYYYEGAAAIDSLTEASRVLIAECCTHAPLSEDIGRVKLPRLLRSKVGEGLQIDMVSGTDYPDDLSGYDLIIQCGACMFNRKYVMSRIERAKRQQVPMTNYGVAIAHLSGILDKITA